MAEPRQPQGALQVHIEYAFDRLHDAKLVQAYSILVPVRERLISGIVKESDHEDGGNLCTGLVRAAARSAHDSEPDGGADRVRQGAQSGGTQRMGLRR